MLTNYHGLADSLPSQSLSVSALAAAERYNHTESSG